MTLNFFFNGIRLVDGQYPRAVVVATTGTDAIPEHLGALSVTVDLPIAAAEGPVAEIREAALRTARELLNESVAARWLADQAQQP